MSELPESPQEARRRKYALLFKIMIVVSWFMLALGFAVIICRIYASR